VKIEHVKEMATQMKLHGLREGIEARQSQSLADGLMPVEYLGLLLEDEIRYRKNARSKRLTSTAKFRYEGELEEWDTSYDRGISKLKLNELAGLSFYRSSQNLIVLGKSGEGKTQLVNAIGRRLCYEGIKTLFYSTNLLFEEVIAERAAGNYLKFIKRINKAPVLILDDFGLRNYTHEEANTLIDLIEERYRKGIVMITSQVSPRGWENLFEDPVIGEAIVDRLKNPSMEVKLRGGSYRTKLAKSS
jgi:DNA replication protein DnaC